MYTESEFFKRKYSSLFRGLAGYYCKRDEPKSRRDVLRHKERSSIIEWLTKSHSKNRTINPYAIDITPHYREGASKARDRTLVRSGNNRYSKPGYEYSTVCAMRQDNWSLPVNIERVKSDANKYEVGANQILKAHSYGDKDSLTLAIGDAAYSNVKFRGKLREEKNIVTITRERINKSVFTKYTGEQKAKGRQRIYGKQMNLEDLSLNYTKSDTVAFEEKTKSGKKIYIVITEYKNLLTRGTKEHSMKENPVNYVKVEVFKNKELNEKMYKRDLWLCVSGDKKDKLSAIEVYQYYKQRFDIEHFLNLVNLK